MLGDIIGGEKKLLKCSMLGDIFGGKLRFWKCLEIYPVGNWKFWKCSTLWDILGGKDPRAVAEFSALPQSQLSKKKSPYQQRKRNKRESSYQRRKRNKRKSSYRRRKKNHWNRIFSDDCLQRGGPEEDLGVAHFRCKTKTSFVQNIIDALLISYMGLGFEMIFKNR